MFAILKTTKYKIWKPTKAVVAEKNNAEILNVFEIIEKPKK